MTQNDEKDWRAIDRAKDQSPHRKEKNVSTQNKDISSTYAYRAFKSKVNKIFDGDAPLPDAWAKKLGTDPKKSKNAQKTETQKLTKLRGKALEEAIPQYEENFGFPQDQTLLIHLLSTSSAVILNKAFDAFENYIQEDTLKDPKALKIRLESLMVLEERPAILKRCRALLDAVKKCI